ncbi:MAG: HAMP domain-containing protein, partial [Pseudomonadota bacterium]|nr:HAMP domain-containing protein [Pseudomonadota bacterium]
MRAGSGTVPGHTPTAHSQPGGRQGTRTPLPLATWLIGAFALLAVVPLLTLATIAVVTSSDALHTSVESKLDAESRLLQRALETQWGEVRNNVRGYAGSTLVQTSLASFPAAFEATFAAAGEDHADVEAYYDEAFAPEYAKRNPGQNAADVASIWTRLDSPAKTAQGALIVANPHPLGAKDQLLRMDDGSDYAKVHDSVHELLRSHLALAGYYDIFLIDRDGRVVFSVFKELDFGTSLAQGPYRESGLADVWRKAMQAPAGEVVLADFELYLPSYDDPAAFMGAPVFVDGQLVGVYAVQIPLQGLDAILAGTSESAHEDAVLVGPDGLMRASTRLRPDEFNVVNSFRNPDRIRIQGDALQQAQQGKSGIVETASYRGPQVLQSFRPVQVGADTRWTLLVEQDTAQAFAPIASQRNLLFIAALGFVLLAVAVGWRLGLLFARPVRELASGVESIMRSGDFSHRVKPRGSREILAAGAALNELLQMLQDALGDTRRVMGRIAEGDFSQQAHVERPGDLGDVARAINAGAARADSAMRGVTQAASALAQADYAFEVDAGAPGQFGVALAALA